MPPTKTHRALPALLIVLFATAAPAQQPPEGSGEKTEPPPTKTETPDSDAAPPAADEKPTEAPPEPPPVVVVEGQVIDAMGRGERGVKVSLRLADETEPLIETETDDIGDFQLRADEEVHGDVVVVIEKQHYEMLERPLHVGHEGALPPFLSEIMNGALVVRGRVIDAASSNGIEGAKVTLQSTGAEWVAETDARGDFKLERVRPGEGALQIDAEGFSRLRHEIDDLVTVPPLTLSLSPGREIVVEIVDPDGRPIRDVTIETYVQEKDDFRTTLSDERGRADIEGLDLTTREILARLTHPEFLSDSGFDRTIELPMNSAKSTHKLVMNRSARIKGRVVEASGGRPITGARVMTGETYSDNSPRAWTDHTGAYDIVGAPDGEVVLTVHARGYAPNLTTVQASTESVAEADFKLSPGNKLSGRVVLKADGDEKKKGIESAGVDATKWRGYGTLGLRAITDRQGNFTIEDAPPDEFEVRVFAQGRRGETFTVRASESPVELAVDVSSPGSARDAGPVVSVGDEVPDVTLKTLDGESIKLRDQKGKIVLLDFWATWCAPCVEELPHFEDIQKKFGDRDDFLLVQISQDWDVGDLKRFLRKRDKMTWPQVAGDDADVQGVCDTFGVKWLPQVFIVGRDGRIAEKNLRGAAIERAVEKLLSEETAP